MASFCYNKVYLIELFPIPFWLIDVTVIAEAVDRITEMMHCLSLKMGDFPKNEDFV
jgi:hypothetical protein